MTRLLTGLLVVGSGVLGIVAGAAPASGFATPNDPGFPRQWGMTKIGAPAAWQRGVTGRGVTIAVVDTGVDLVHADLKDKVVAGCNIVAHNGCATSPQDDNGHGTHVAGIAAAETNNGLGVAGVAPDARIMPVKVLDANGSGTDTDVQSGVQWAVDHGAKVINLSLGSEVQGITGSTLGAAVEYAWAHGALAVVAAGNSYVTGSGFSTEHALVVSATDRNDQKPPYSSGVGSAMWGISAPGGSSFGVSLGDNPNDIWSTWWDGTTPSTYGYDSGTSMATPHVSGAAADLFSQGLSAQQVVDTLLNTATAFGQPGTFGRGRLNLDAASAAAAATSPGGGGGGAGGGAGAGGGPGVSTGVTTSAPPSARGGSPTASPSATKRNAGQASATALSASPGPATSGPPTSGAGPASSTTMPQPAAVALGSGGRGRRSASTGPPWAAIVIAVLGLGGVTMAATRATRRHA